MNRELAGIETLFVPTAPQVGHLSSSLIKQIATFGGDVSRLVPKAVHERLLQLRSQGKPSWTRPTRTASNEVVYRLYETVDELTTVIENARSVPMSASCMVPRDHLLDLLDDASRCPRTSRRPARSSSSARRRRLTPRSPTPFRSMPFTMPSNAIPNRES